MLTSTPCIRCRANGGTMPQIWPHESMSSRSLLNSETGRPRNTRITTAKYPQVSAGTRVNSETPAQASDLRVRLSLTRRKSGVRVPQRPPQLTCGNSLHESGRVSTDCRARQEGGGHSLSIAGRSRRICSLRPKRADDAPLRFCRHMRQEHIEEACMSSMKLHDRPAWVRSRLRPTSR